MSFVEQRRWRRQALQSTAAEQHSLWSFYSFRLEFPGEIVQLPNDGWRGHAFGDRSRHQFLKAAREPRVGLGCGLWLRALDHGSTASPLQIQPALFREDAVGLRDGVVVDSRSEEHTSELQSPMYLV